MLRDIVVETNHYVVEVYAPRSLLGVSDRKAFTMPTCKAFFAIVLFIGMKKQPNVKSYWF